ncbi:epoxide hydrolase family protein [Sphingomonas adhaesiva]|uniref:epoxide hydrolase family protein n=1 Tax=Sphingomonas adhaesiva TaxID=28212 RepID=UPI002FFBE9DA
MDAVTPHPFAFPDGALADLKARLAATRWPERETVDGWQQGAPLERVQALCAHWRDRHDWRACEARLNALNPCMTEIDGLDIHFLHVRSPEPDATPLILTHGWPGSVIEFLDVVGPLSDPRAHGGDAAEAFHLVIPSLPGFGLSGKPRETGWGVQRIAGAWIALMKRLGYDRFMAQGGDWGSAVTHAIGASGDPAVTGIHVNMVVAGPAEDQTGDLTEAEKAAIAAGRYYQEWGNGYAVLQSTRPQTIGYALTDSPAGQASWIYEKFGDWTDRGEGEGGGDGSGAPEAALSIDRMLDNITLYWLSATAASSARLYWESFRTFAGDAVTIPVGCSIFPREIMRPSRRWAERRYPQIVHWGEPARGGHFAAFEQPALFVEEVRATRRALP